MSRIEVAVVLLAAVPQGEAMKWILGVWIVLVIASYGWLFWAVANDQGEKRS